MRYALGRNERLTVSKERVDAMPLVPAQGQRMGLPALWDEHGPPHGHWPGRSLGWVAGSWLPPILSEGDPRRNHVEPWGQPRLWTLRSSPGQPVPALAGTADRREVVLRALRDEARWEAFASALHRHGRRG